MIRLLLCSLLQFCLAGRLPTLSRLCRKPATAPHNQCPPASFLFHFFTPSWDNPICLSPSVSLPVSAIIQVDQVDKDT